MTGTRTWLACLHIALLLAIAAAHMPALAQQASPPVAADAATDQQSDAPPAEAAAADAAPVGPSLQDLTDRIGQLEAGTLPAEIDARALFSTPPTPEGRIRLGWVLQMVDDKALFDAARKDAARLENLTPEAAALAIRQAGFLRLSTSRRDRLLAAHDAKVTQARNAEAAEAAQAAELDGLRAEKQALEAFLAGEPTDLGYLDFTLINADGTLLAKTRRAALLDAIRTPDLVAEAADDGASPDTETPERDQLRSAIATLQQQILQLPAERLSELNTLAALTPEERDALFGGPTEQELAEKARAEALAAEKAAQDELQKLIASERTGLADVRVRQSSFSASLDAELSAITEVNNAALRLRRQVRELLETPDFTPGREASADRLYTELVAELRKVRRQLGQALDGAGRRDTADLKPDALDVAVPRQSLEYQELETLRLELADQSAMLAARQRELLWQQRSALRDAMNLLNNARLDLIPELSSDMRTRMLGFGTEGLAQARREVDQISLEMRFIGSSLPQQLRALADPLVNPTAGSLLALLKLAIFLLGIYWWNHYGGAILRNVRQQAREKSPPTLISMAQDQGASYLYRVRKQATVLVLIIGVQQLLPTHMDFIGFRYLWIILLWVASAALALKLVDAIARGNQTSEDPRAQLRWRSLRLVIGVALAVGLILSLTNATVGKGAIYSWTWQSCWFAVPPIMLILGHWWRERIETLAALRTERGALFAWVARRPGGLAGLIGRVAAGAVMLANGFRFVLLRRINEFALIRDINDRRARGKAMQQAELDLASGRFRHISDEAFAALGPHRLPAQNRDLTMRPGNISLNAPEAGTITIIVGERGLGKTAFLHDIASMSSFDKVLRYTAEPEGFDKLAGHLRPELDALGPSALTTSTADARPVNGLLIIIDDCQRLIVPAIGGIHDFDQLIDMARSAPHNVAWVLGMGRPAWRFLTRARQDRVLFDQVLSLPEWSVDEITDLIERRTEQAGIAPDFSLLDDVLDFRFDGNLSPDGRKRKIFLEDLHDYSGGNPAVALEHWRRSLFVEVSSGRTVVRHPPPPNVKALSNLPQSSVFILRALLQMNFATQTAIEQSTDLPPMVVRDSLRSLLRIGAIACQADAYYITLFWWVEVVRLLQRQNMLMKGAVL